MRPACQEYCVLGIYGNLISQDDSLNLFLLFLRFGFATIKYWNSNLKMHWKHICRKRRPVKKIQRRLLKSAHDSC